MKPEILALGEWLSKFPYENLTKRHQGEPRGPLEMRQTYDSQGAGGTCFSLVNLAAHYARNELNLHPRFFLGDRPRGDDRHCVLGFPQEGVFLDPGYLCFGPLPLNPEEPFQLSRPQNVLHLKPTGPARLKVQTERKGQLTWRYTLKTDPVSQDRFERAWRESFRWESFTDSYVMTKQRENDMLLFLNGRLESISQSERTIITTPDETNDRDFLASTFGVSPELIERANLSVHR